ncbi:betaine/carnitine transporter, BCCT family [Palleronia marisminoris]|uniref:Glycine betaine transporter OpuD n=1 Tax=Palleronia marisminoris TaxID=315423 RepID=A0A1Y5TFG4_9RHOB|nr:BCCT family transporter [Palleronia marisminoris]SFH37417.1 betaine/carnitine transporter, BCCT family [Palleronia marisminoris]SLN62603.1 Glycine betaine transporter OpuD [Palleronia marisminoris]
MTDESAGTDIPTPDGAVNTIDTDYTVGQDNYQGGSGALQFDIHNPVFLISSLTIVAFVLVTLIFQDSASAVFNWLFTFVTTTFDWFFLAAANIFVIFCLAIAISPLGRVRLGGSDAKPDYGYPSWFAMLFAAGMGIGLMFFGVLEPVYHMQVSGPLGLDGPFVDGELQPDQVASARAHGLSATIFHWALHPWSIYAVVALSLALFTYNKQLPLSIRSAFYPLLGDRVWGWPGHMIDIIAVFATLFGLTTSLGLGAQQATAGMNYVYGVPNTLNTQIIVIACVTAVALISVVRGLDGGVKVLSNINMFFAGILLLFVFLAGPTLQILQDAGIGLVTYVRDVVPLSNPFGRDDDSFRESWTAFYWAWWISWSPFVGMFIARVSRGRTVREFVTCVILIPSLVSVFWMATFGGSAIHQVVQQGQESGVYENVIANYNDAIAMFAMLGALPLTAVTSTLAIILVLVFFITSSDSGSLVIDTITAGGKTEAPTAQRIFWATTEGIVAIVLLIGGGLTALQAMVNATGIFFTVVLLFLCYSTYKGLMSEPRE